jgi:hypothetical protein
MDADDDTKEILAAIGVLIVVMQITEKLVDGVITYVLQGKERLTFEVLSRLQREQQSRTLGRLVKQMRERVDLHPGLDKLLTDFVLHRNQLTHRLDDVQGWDLVAKEGRKVASRFLSQLRSENQKVLEIFTGFQDVFAALINVCADKAIPASDSPIDKEKAERWGKALALLSRIQPQINSTVPF